MYVVVREITQKPGQDLSDRERAESEDLLSALPGFYGQLMVDIGAGKLIRIAVWESHEGRAASSDRDEVQRAGEVFEGRQEMALIGQGRVISNTLLKG
jgi:hypothetical protein